jgi:hypothetical protein
VGGENCVDSCDNILVIPSVYTEYPFNNFSFNKVVIDKREENREIRDCYSNIIEINIMLVDRPPKRTMHI